LASFAAAEATAARLGATEISNSFGGPEFLSEQQYDPSFNHPGVAVVASAGDHGYGVQYPAASPGVVAVGGTLLTLNSDNTWNTESVWGRANSVTGQPEGTGSGCSALESANTWQTNTNNWLFTGCKGNTQDFRPVADVAADADPISGVAIYASTNTSGTAGWIKLGGTSLAAPIIAGVFALAGGVPAGTNAQQIPYDRFRSANSHDVTTDEPSTQYQQGNGPNTNGAFCRPPDPNTNFAGDPTYPVMCNGEVGYDGPTGVGTPNGVTGFQP
jgi:subtilase family serine protease